MLSNTHSLPGHIHSANPPAESSPVSADQENKPEIRLSGSGHWTRRCGRQNLYEGPRLLLDVIWRSVLLCRLETFMLQSLSGHTGHCLVAWCRSAWSPPWCGHWPLGQTKYAAPENLYMFHSALSFQHKLKQWYTKFSSCFLFGIFLPFYECFISTFHRKHE